MPPRRQCCPPLLQHCGPRCWAVCFRSPWLYLTLVYLSLAVGLTIISYRNFKVYQQQFSTARCSIPPQQGNNQSETETQGCENTPGQVDWKLVVDVYLDGDKYEHINLLYKNGTEIGCVSNDVLATLTAADGDDDSDNKSSFKCWFHRRSRYARSQSGSFIRSGQAAAKNKLIACVILASSCLILLLLPVWRMFRHHNNRNNRNNRSHDPMIFPSVLHHLPPPMYAIVVTERLNHHHHHHHAPSPSSSRHRRALSQREASAVIAQLRARYKEKGRSSELSDANVCPICLEELDESEKSENGGGLVCFPCDHVFHAVCAEQWLRKGAPKCPYCMEELKLDKVCASAAARGEDMDNQFVGQDDVRVVVVDDEDEDEDEDVDNRDR